MYLLEAAGNHGGKIVYFLVDCAVRFHASSIAYRNPRLSPGRKNPMLC